MAIGTEYIKQKIKIKFRVCNLAYTSLLKTQPICNPLPRDRCIWDWSYKITIAYTYVALFINLNNKDFTASLYNSLEKEEKKWCVE